MLLAAQADPWRGLIRATGARLWTRCATCPLANACTRPGQPCPFARRSEYAPCRPKPNAHILFSTPARPCSSLSMALRPFSVLKDRKDSVFAVGGRVRPTDIRRTPCSRWCCGVSITAKSRKKVKPFAFCQANG
jgi:hypothetical protein